MENTVLSGYEDFLKMVKIGIGEVAEITGVPVRKLRYWQDKGIIEPVDPESTSRQFDLANLKKIIMIKELIDEGYTLDSAAAKVQTRCEKINSVFALISL